MLKPKLIMPVVFVSSLLGSVVAPHFFNHELREPVVKLTGGLKDCGPDGHPDTGDLIIVLCK